MATNPYDAVRYPCWPRLETHPDRLAAVATLYGLPAPALERCRVLEVGCGDGGNLLPMAYAMPAAEFVGIDLAAAPVAEARRTIRALGLRNVRVLRADLRRPPAGLGRFDYVVAHGLYSWIPPGARDALLALCAKTLSPGGLSFVSYNVYPGRHMRQMLREMMLYHGGGPAQPRQAREFLEVLRDSAAPPAGWGGMLRDEIESILTREPASLFHDDLAPVNDPVYYHEFAAHARRFGLDCVGDAHVHESTDARGLVSTVRNRVAREQYLDFLQLRRFRQTVLCRAGAKPSLTPQPRRLGRLAFSSPARVEGEFREGANRVRIRRGDPAVEAVADRLSAAWPRPVPFADLRAAHPAAREVVFSMLQGGFIEPHAWTFPAVSEAGPRPRASALARFQLTRSLYVTNLCHRTLHLDEPIASLLALLDGTRDRAALGRAWTTSARTRRNLDGMLEWMAPMALLEE